MITRSARISCGLKRLGAGLSGIPDDVAMKLQHLVWLYGMADPEVPSIDEDVADDEDAIEQVTESPATLLSPPRPSAGTSAD